MTLIAPRKVELLEAELTSVIISVFFEVYNYLGFGFLERAYANAMEKELVRRGLSVRREVPIALFYKGEVVGRYRADMIVDGTVLIEVKANTRLCEADHNQLRNYQRATKTPVALLMNFGPKPSFHRSIFGA